MAILSPDIGEKLAGLQVRSGTTSVPGLAFQEDPDTGFILDAPGRIGVVSAGVLAAILPDDLITTEELQDVVGAMLANTASVNLAYNDPAGTFNATVLPAGVDHGGLGGLADDDHSTYALVGHSFVTTGVEARLTGETVLAVSGGLLTLVGATVGLLNSAVDHGGLSGLADDDHTQYLLASGARALTAGWSTGAFSITLGATLLGAAIDLGTSGSRMGTAWLAALNTSGDATIGDQLLVSGVGPHAIGGAVDTSSQITVQGTYAGSGGDTHGVKMLQGVTGQADFSAFGQTVAVTFNRGTSGTHPHFTALSINAPIINAGPGGLANATTVRIISAPTGATNNYALWVDAGLVRWDDPIALGGADVASFGTIGGSGPATAAQHQWLRVNIDGVSNFIPVWR